MRLAALSTVLLGTGEEETRPAFALRSDYAALHTRWPYVDFYCRDGMLDLSQLIAVTPMEYACVAKASLHVRRYSTSSICHSTEGAGTLDSMAG